MLLRLPPAGGPWGQRAPQRQGQQEDPGQCGNGGYDERLSRVVSELIGKNIEDVIAQGISKLASVPAGRAVTTSVAPGSAAPAAGAAPAAAEDKRRVRGRHGVWPVSLDPGSPQ